MQENQRLAGSFRTGKDAPDLRVDPVAFETGEEIVAHGAPLAGCNEKALRKLASLQRK
jgi:hypothetical protein